MAASDYAHFAAIPWCAAHLQGDRIVAQPPPSRVRKPSTEDSLFSDTFNTDRTFRNVMQVYEEPLSPTEPVTQLKTFFTLGNGMNGHPDVCHGGIVMTMLDEGIGGLVPLALKRKTASGLYMTAYLNTKFVKPVPTPSTVLVRGRTTSVEGRKYFVEGTIEDEHGAILARGEVLFVRLKSTL